jgi:hypothetical protein
LTNAAGSNRLLSILTGRDWSSSADDLTFVDKGPAYEAAAAARLQARGIYAARERIVGATPVIVLRKPNGFVSAESMLACLRPVVFPEPFDTRIPKDALVIYNASSWDDTATVEKRCSGQCIIVEYPPTPDELVSAAWLKHESSIPEQPSTHVPGLIRANQLFPLLRTPALFGWKPADSLEGPTPQQWMATIVRTKRLQLGALCALTFLAGLAIVRGIASEASSKALRTSLWLILLLLPSLYVVGNLAPVIGLSAWNVLPFVGYALLALTLAPIYFLIRLTWPNTHPLFGLAIPLSILLLVGDPLNTVVSHVFTATPVVVSPIALGLLVACLTGSIAFSLNGGWWPRLFASALTFAALALALGDEPWWARDKALLIVPVLAVLAGSGAMRAYLLPVFILWPFLYHPWNGGLAWDVHLLLQSSSDQQAINTAEQMKFLASPAWLFLLAGMSAGSLIGGRFLRLKLHRAFVDGTAARPLFWAALCTASMGLREPYLLSAALVAFTAGLLVLLFDAAGTP